MLSSERALSYPPGPSASTGDVQAGAATGRPSPLLGSTALSDPSPRPFCSCRTAEAEDRRERPNLVWIIVEDISPEFGCCGSPAVPTPHVDRLAGLPVPAWVQGRDLLANDDKPRRNAFAAHDRCDQTVDHLRCVRTRQHKYLRNFLPQRPYLQPNRYKDDKPIAQAMRRLNAAGRLSRDQALIMAETRLPEAIYDSDMRLHLLGLNDLGKETLRANIALMQRWAAERR